MSAAEIAQAAFGLALLQTHDDNADLYEMLSLLVLESLAMLSGRDPATFGALVNGLAVFARMRCAEQMAAAVAGQPASPLGWQFQAQRIH